MVETEPAVESSTTRNRSRRVTPEEIEGFQGVSLNPGGDVDVLNVSNTGILVETQTRTKPGGAIQVHIAMVDADHVLQARIVRSEIKTAGQGLHYELAIAFDETQHLVGSNDAPAVDSSAPRGDEILVAESSDEADGGLRYAQSVNRW